MEALPKPIVGALRRQKYQLVEGHSAVKKCRWLHESLVRNRTCYKQKFFGIESHRCLQMTPTLSCNMGCRFCWRVHPEDLGVRWKELNFSSWHEPKEIVSGCIDAQRRMLIGYKAQVKDGKISRAAFEEALNPKHVAISLSGEPTLYPMLGDLIGEFHKAGFTTFLVTNGSKPEVLETLSEEPTQLYVSVYASNEKMFKDVCRPKISNAWRKIGRTLSLIPSFSCPTVLRLTLALGLNMMDPDGYARMVEESSPTYVEPKGAMFVGNARRRIMFENMPKYSRLRDFALKLGGMIGYELIDESPESRVVLLSRLKKPLRFGNP